MAYCTPDDVRGVLVSLGDPFDNTPATLTDTQLEQLIADTQAIVDGFTGTTYDDVDVPQIVAKLTKDVAAYDAYLIYNKSRQISARDPVELRYQRALQLLQNIQKGLVTVEPYNEDQPDQPTPGEVFVQNPYTGQLFDMGNFRLGPVPGAVDETYYGDRTDEEATWFGP